MTRDQAFNSIKRYFCFLQTLSELLSSENNSVSKGGSRASVSVPFPWCWVLQCHTQYLCPPRQWSVWHHLECDWELPGLEDAELPFQLHRSLENRELNLWGRKTAGSPCGSWNAMGNKTVSKMCKWNITMEMAKHSSHLLGKKSGILNKMYLQSLSLSAPHLG